MSEFRSHPSVMAECISNSTACESLCIEALAHCQLKGGNLAKPKLVSLLAVCADVCALGARTMQRGSEAHVFTCAACSEVCALCAEACAAFPEDPLLRACASACTMCSRCCADMARVPAKAVEGLQRSA